MKSTDQTAFEKFWEKAGSGDRELAVAAWKAGAEAARADESGVVARLDAIIDHTKDIWSVINQMLEVMIELYQTPENGNGRPS